MELFSVELPRHAVLLLAEILRKARTEMAELSTRPGINYLAMDSTFDSLKALEEALPQWAYDGESKHD